MPFYQFYDFCAIDQPLSPEQRSEIETYSSRSTPSSHRATFVYNYGSFKYEAKEVLLKHFDMALELNSWGTYRLMMKLPLQLVDLPTFKRYNLGSLSYEGEGQVYTSARDTYAFIDLHHSTEDHRWEEGEGLLDRLLPLRAQLLRGDCRVLFLAWLHMASENAQIHKEEPKEEDEEASTVPPIPAGLGQLDSALESFVEFWQIDQGLIQAAAQRSTPPTPTPNLSNQISQLTESEKDDFLHQLLTESGPTSLRLRHRLQQSLPSSPSVPSRPYSLSELLAEREHQLQLIKEAEEQAQAQRHQEHMQLVGGRQSSMWEEVHSHAALKTAYGYKTATKILVELQDYAEYSGEPTTFANKLNLVLKQFGRSQAFLRRLEENGVI